MSKIMILSDSYKHSASSKQIGEWLKEGFLMQDKHLDIDVFPVADGGEGTLEALLSSLGGVKKQTNVPGIFGETISVSYGKNESSIFIESAEVIGIEKTGNLNPWSASSYGLGVLMKRLIIEDKPQKIYIGIGGTATNDGGIGFLQGLGADVLDNKSEQVTKGMKGLSLVNSITLSAVDDLFKEVEVIVLSDVQNPLCGPTGATYLFGPQKGVEEKDLASVDVWMEKFAIKLSQHLGVSLQEKPGSGAAGGLGLALMALPNVTFQSGVESILEMAGIEKKLKRYDLVITGEGRMDGQSQLGKVPIGIAKMTRESHVPLFAIVGSQSRNQKDNYKLGIDLIIDCVNEPMSLNQAIENVEVLVKNASQTAYYAYKLIGKFGEKER